MVITVLVATAILALIHLYYFDGKNGKADYVYLFVLFVVMGLNSQNADYIPYEEIYNNISGNDNLFMAFKNHPDKGWVLINWLSASIGLEFAEFHFLCYVVLLSTVFYIAKRLGAPICIFFLTYLAYPMFMDTIQLRNFAISVLFLVSIYCYAHKTVKWYAVGIATLLFAVSIQPMALVFLPFIVFYWVYQSRRFGKLTYIFLVLGLSFPIIKELIHVYWTEIVTILHTLASMASRGSEYIGNEILDSRLLKIYIVVIVFAYILYHVKNYVLSLDNVSELQKEFSRLSFVVYLYLICWMPMFTLSLEFANRLPRDGFISAYIIIGIYVHQIQIKKKKFGIVLLTIFIAYFFGLVDLYIASLRHNVDIILNNNFLL